jgi:hypothetical protein
MAWKKPNWLKLWAREPQKIGSFSRGLGALAGVQDGHADQPLAAVMVHIAILTQDTVRGLLGPFKTQV